jgi:hypothetical protein
MYYCSTVKCSECGRETEPHRGIMFDKASATCAQPECQRARKSRLQRERREQERKEARAKAEHKRELWREQKRRQRAGGEK